eukprot:6059614-Prymnesium_polylepis.1
MLPRRRVSAVVGRASVPVARVGGSPPLRAWSAGSSGGLPFNTVCFAFGFEYRAHAIPARWLACVLVPSVCVCDVL